MLAYSMTSNDFWWLPIDPRLKFIGNGISNEKSTNNFDPTNLKWNLSIFSKSINILNSEKGHKVTPPSLFIGFCCFSKCLSKCLFFSKSIMKEQIIRIFLCCTNIFIKIRSDKWHILSPFHCYHMVHRKCKCVHLEGTKNWQLLTCDYIRSALE